MAYTTLEYETLVKAIAQGALSVEYGDKKVTYRSLEEMLRLKKSMEVELGITSGTSSRRYATHSKGLK